MKRFILAGALQSLSLFAVAGDTGYAEIAWMNVERGNIYIKMDPELNLSSCGDSTYSKTIVKIDVDSDGFSEMYSMTLAAYMAGQKVKFWIDGCSMSPWANTEIPNAYAAQLCRTGCQ